MPSTVDLRAALLDAAEAQLVASPDDEIATRSVCEAVGVSQPVLYRIFGDKRGLLDALAERGLGRYLARKSALAATGDPVDDLIAGFADHHRFADENPALYRLMFSPRPWSSPRARTEIHAVLVATLTRVAAAGRLRLDPDTAAGIVLCADVGLALNRIAQPDVFGSEAALHAVRDAVFGAILTDTAEPAPPDPLRDAARSLRHALPQDGGPLEAEEAALLRRWLDRLARTQSSATSSSAAV